MLLCMQVCTLCLCCHGCDPNLMTSLCTFTTPSLPPGTTLLLPLNTNTHAGVLPALALSNLMRLQNADFDNLVKGCFALLPESGADADGKILGESGLANQTNSAPLFARGLSTTSLPAEADHAVRCGQHCFRRCRGGGLFSTLSSTTRRAYNS
jgi:hypothetical protein